MKNSNSGVSQTPSGARVFGVLGIVVLGACAHATPPPQGPEVVATTTTSAPAPRTHEEDARVVVGDLDVDARIVDACALDIGAAERAPTFAFDDDALSPRDASILADVAKCFTTGSLSGRSLLLTGRADPRGEEEYNLALGARRAENAAIYIEILGVSPERVSLTSRGKLDAAGTDEAGWARDRRVDLTLLQQKATP